MSPDPKDEFFADGLTEELIFSLSRVKELQVIAFTSVMKYRGEKKTVHEIAGELSVGAVLEGSVRKAGDRLRITLQLIDAEDDKHLWSEAYNRALGDVFAVQTEVARQVVSALEGQLLPKAVPPQLSHANPEAYASYLKGRVLLATRSAESIRAAIESLERAVALDSSRAEAHAALAIAHVLLYNYSVRVPTDWLPRAQATALQALRIDPNLAEAHAAHALVLEDQWDWDGAERGFRRALTLSPSYAPARHWLGNLLFLRGQWAEGIAELERALDLDPLSAAPHTALGSMLFFAGELDRALAELNRALALGRDSRSSRLRRGAVYASQGQRDLARVDFEKARDLAESFDPFAEFALASLEEASAVKGRLECARREILERAERESVSPYALSLFAFALGRDEEGFALLERALSVRDNELCVLAVDPRLAAWRTDPRFANLVKRIGLAK